VMPMLDKDVLDRSCELAAAGHGALGLWLGVRR
jgi:hypothetical protein